MSIKWETNDEIAVPKGISVEIDNGHVKFSGPKGSTSRVFRDNYVRIEKSGDKVLVQISKKNKRNLAIAGTWGSMTRTLFKGVSEGFTYEMKIDYTHFPMRVSVKGNTTVIENFLGERSHRSAEIVGSSKVSVKGDRITITGVDKEEIGHTASNIERATKIKGFDLRVFQDGIYLLGGVGDESA